MYAVFPVSFLVSAIEHAPYRCLYRYRIGESFVLLPFNKAKKMLAADQEAVNKEIESIRNRLDEHTGEMKQLKVTLYGKFGTQINLD
jgi:prefoldin subunit 4